MMVVTALARRCRPGRRHPAGKRLWRAPACPSVGGGDETDAQLGATSPQQRGILRATLPTMRDQIDFDERTAAQLEVVYRTRDIRRRRALAQKALDCQP